MRDFVFSKVKNKKFRLPFAERIPLTVHRGNGTLLFVSQFNTMREDGWNGGYYFEYSAMSENESVDEIGVHVLTLLKKFKKYADPPLTELQEKLGMSLDEYYNKTKYQRLELAGAEDYDELFLKYDECSLLYTLEKDKYSFHLSWPVRKGKRYEVDGAMSTGKAGILTFAEALEFDDTVAPEELGRMILEALDRSKRLAEAAKGNLYPSKELTLLDESILNVQMPRDKHFVDAEDLGVAEIYQAYEYVSREGAAPAACFYVGIGGELDCSLATEHIRQVWEGLYGKAEQFEVTEGAYGIFTLRAELKNKKIHRVSYFLQQEEDLLLECAMEFYQPEKRKKLAETLPELFEKFAKECKKRRL